MKIAFDLDGILCNKPPIVPRDLLELLFKGCQKGLHYRYPKSKSEQLVRKLSHFYLFRPTIKSGFNLLKKHQSDQIFLISARYSFLAKETDRWLVKRKIKHLFQNVYLNSDDEQPHLFKEKIIKLLNPDTYYEDDPAIVNYLKKQFPNLKINP